MLTGSSNDPGPTVSADDVTIRAAHTGEMPRIRELIGTYPDLLQQDDLPRIASFFVAEVGGQIVGCCALQIYSRRLGEVRSLAVRVDFRGQRIASRLVEACRDRARERRVRQLLAVTSNTAFFERAGFKMHSGWRTALFHDLDDAG